MKSLKAIRDSRKYFLTFVMLSVLTFFYFRLDNAATEYKDRIENFKTWGWIFMGIGAAYLGANAYQNNMTSSYDSSAGDTVIINKDKPLPEK